MKTVMKCVALALCGGCVYLGIELLWRGHTHWTMALVGGICFVIIGGINELFTWEMSLFLQGVIGAACVTVIELVSGLILNVWLGMGIWDYSSQPFNLAGQICLGFVLLWIPLSIFGVVLDDWLRYFLFDEERPRYKLF